MKNVVKFPVAEDMNEKLSTANEQILKKESKHSYPEPSFIDFVRFILGLKRKQKRVKSKSNGNVVDIGVEKQPPTINPIIKKMYYAKDYTVNHLAHYTFIVDGEEYTFGIIELEMMGIFNK